MSLTARHGPAAVWIELTSKCPLRCVFCSRENLRGEGEHMDFTLLKSVVASLDRPEIIRLNYSGESANYPWLIEAIAHAKAGTRAHVEMVRSLVSMPMETLRRLAGSGIDRISISLHSLDKQTFPILYGGGGFEAFERRLATLLQTTRRALHPPAIDFAFVAMNSNVNELPAVAALAAASGAALLSVHPVIRRPGVPALFEAEANADGKLHEAFRDRLDSQLELARLRSSAMQISVARPPHASLHRGAFTCEQNPFETVHILANGDVVPCEVLDGQPLGNASASALHEVWHGVAYEVFRERYAKDQISECHRCVFRVPVEQTGAIRTLWGWHDRDEDGTLWSRTTCSFECESNAGNSLWLSGVLPAGPQTNSLQFLRDGLTVALIRNHSTESLQFQVELSLDSSVKSSRFVAAVEHGFSPWRQGASHDARELGFALFHAELRTTGARPSIEETARAAPPSAPLRNGKAVALLFGALSAMQPIAASSIFPITPAHTVPHDSLAVIIPERGNPTALAVCLAALKAALSEVSLCTQVVIVVNGSDRTDYAELVGKHPEYHFIFVARALGFTAAIRTGLRHVQAGWTYLLNNDVWLARDALSAVLRHRSSSVFSLASHIRMIDHESEKETGRTGIEFVGGLVNLLELDGIVSGPVEHLYSGGGSSLFQTRWLRQFASSATCYDPFYWEDVEWGVRARSSGLLNLFVPESSVRHVGKATVRRFYERGEVARIFERNRLQFQLRCIPEENRSAVRERLIHAPRSTVRELLHPRRLMSMAHVRATLRHPAGASSPQSIQEKEPDRSAI